MSAILEAKWPWPGKFTFHFHGIPEERGAMGYFNVTNSPANAVDGKDVAITKSISMIDWQANLTKSLQKENPNRKATTTSTASVLQLITIQRVEWKNNKTTPTHKCLSFPTLLQYKQSLNSEGSGYYWR